MALTDPRPSFDYDAVWTFGERLRKARRKPLTRDRMTLQEFADTLGVTTQNLSNWENDTNRPRDILTVAWKVAELTGYPITWLLRPSAPPTGFEPVSSPFDSNYAYCEPPILGVIHGVATLFDVRPYQTTDNDPLLRLLTHEEEGDY